MSPSEFAMTLAGAIALDFGISLELSRALLERCGGRPSLVCHIVRLAREKACDPLRLADATLRPAAEIAMPGWVGFGAPPAQPSTRQVVAQLARGLVDARLARCVFPLESPDRVANFTVACFAGLFDRWMTQRQERPVWS